MTVTHADTVHLPSLGNAVADTLAGLLALGVVVLVLATTDLTEWLWRKVRQK